MNNVMKVVFIAFIDNGKLLVSKSVRSSKQGLYTLIGGAVENDETLLEAAIREAKEEINSDFDIKQKDLELLFHYIEPAASDPNLNLEFNIFLAHKKIDVELQTNLEILEHKWYDIYDCETKLSSAIVNYFMPYAIEKGLLY